MSGLAAAISAASPNIIQTTSSRIPLISMAATLRRSRQKAMLPIKCSRNLQLAL
jgi:hypothetical protein